MSVKTVCIDARMAFASGVGTYLRGLLSEVSDDPSPHFSFAVLRRSRDSLQISLPTRTVDSPIYSLSEQWAVPRAARQLSADLLHSPHYNMPAFYASKTVVTVHDLIHLIFPEFLPSLIAKAYASFFFFRVLPKARAIITVSEHTKSDLIERLGIAGSRITVTPLGLSTNFRPLSRIEAAPALSALGLTNGYFLFVGNLKQFKNVEFLVGSYLRMAASDTACPPLVMVGRNFIPGFDRTLKASPKIRWLGEVAPSLLPALYSQALAFVFPSLYEGFGIPPLEAMGCGTPVICSNRASLPEVVGEAAILIDPTKNDDLIDAMRQIAADSALRSRLTAAGLKRAAQFSWKATAAKTLAVYEDCLQ